MSEKSAPGVESPPGLSHSLPTSATYSDVAARTRAVSVDSQYSLEYDFNQAPAPEVYDPYAPQVFTPHFESYAQYQPYPPTPYEVDIKTERQMYVNDIPTRRDSSISTFSTFQPPPTHGGLPPLPEDDWLHDEVYDAQADLFGGGEEGLDFNYFDFANGPPPNTQSAVVQVDDCDRPLLEHFIDKVLKLIFPILEVNQHGSARSGVILPALESNKCYLHCCLSIAAIHLKSTERRHDEQIDSDIMRHRYATISELCAALQKDTDHLQILEAALGMIFFQCSVGRPDDCLPDIPWHQHFQAASDLVRRLELPDAVAGRPAPVHPPFNMALTSWIDILGATMLGRAPLFANHYRDRHLSGAGSGLCELMGCEDRIMYLISEIACLEALKIGQVLDDMQLCEHIQLLGEQMNLTEPAPGTGVEVDGYAASAYSTTGAIRPRQLSRTMTAAFRLAARIWLCSLAPGSQRTDGSMMDLVARLARLLALVPAGPDGFDRSLVWPLLIGGAQSVAGSPFRSVFEERVVGLGEAGKMGSFGRMLCLLREVWGRQEELEMGKQPSGEVEEVVQSVHWRDVMRQQGWDFLLI